MDSVGRVKEIGEAISKELQSRKDKIAADAKDAIRTLAKCVKELVERAERGTLSKVDADLDALAADVTRKMGRIALAGEEAKRAKSLLIGMQEEVLAIREAKRPEASAVTGLFNENKGLKEQNAELRRQLEGKTAADPPTKKTEPAGKTAETVAHKTTPAAKDGEKTPEQEAEEQAGKGGAAK